MIKKLYVFAWLMLAASVLFSVAIGPLNGLQMVAFSLIGVALVYGFALWAVFNVTEDTQVE